MLFCESCKNTMTIIEKEVDNCRKLMYECKKCDITQHCSKVKFMNKNYNRKEILDCKNNKYKINDTTMPTRKSKCPHCNEKNVNPYEIRHVNNYYCINMICKKCYKNWVH